ncbi:histidine kinase [Pseudomonas plecoglossicida]|uniref:histidine kinase n=1 Tax=Pseudomonas plecoglossicida TaxID=70775 RepID=UPI003D1B46BB
MRQPYVLIHQARPSHQILLHQACNALGFFDVRVTEDLNDLKACLVRDRGADLLILDHAGNDGLAVLEHVSCEPPRAVLFVGQAGAGQTDLVSAARQHGLWVLAELPWPLPMQRWQQALRHIQTVTSPTHAH